MFERGSGGYSTENFGPDLKVLDGIASWCGGLHGSMPLAEALRALMMAFDATAGAVSRHHRNQDRPRAVALVDSDSGISEIATLRRPLCDDVLGYFYEKARTSTVWFMSDHMDDPNWSATQTLQNWKLSRNIAEIVVLVLEGSLQQHDYIEFHFDHELARSERLEIEALLPTLVRAWSGRKTGLVTQAQMDDRMIRHRAAAQAYRQHNEAPILGMSNPAKLSRAEFRVCLLLARGLSVKGITDELGLSEATVRSHLRSIYSKTEVTGMQELMYRILSSGSDDSGQGFAVR